jgi:hypothetical protein|tara:strand:+ start:667 stop:831 length:165 start_codon:yes stop_codon:yes gene_type:complete
MKKEIPAEFIPEISADHQQFYDDLAKGEKLLGDSNTLIEGDGVLQEEQKDAISK